MSTFDNTQDVIDSRDIIERIEELEGADTLEKEEAEELAALQALRTQCEGYADWEHGETLIHETYFVTYIEELIDDCYSLPKEMKSGEWPWRHMKIDFEAAAKEAKQDYAEVDFDGQAYLIRA